MSNVSKKMLMAAAGASGGDALTVGQVFSTDLFTGRGNNTGGDFQVTNGLDLSGEGGLVWLKAREDTYFHELFDTERGVNSKLSSNADSVESTNSALFTSFNSDGYTIGQSSNALYTSGDSVGWTFRKAPKFFDVHLVTGTGSDVTINHVLDADVGMVFLKNTDQAHDWIVWHRNDGSTPLESKLNLTQTGGTPAYVTATSTSSITVANLVSGNDYSVHIFAHDTSDESMIQCGNYTGNSGSSKSVSLGYEPQFIFIKNTTTSNNWIMFDTMRGLGVPSASSPQPDLHPNLTTIEEKYRAIGVTSDGFEAAEQHMEINYTNNNYTYMAVRAPMMAEVTDATDVFDLKTYQGSSNFTSLTGLTTSRVDSTLNFIRTGYGAGAVIWSRLTGPSGLKTWSTAAEGDISDTAQFDFNNKITITGGNTGSGGSQYINYFWKRAKSYFDVVAYSGTSSARTIAHGLGAAPEMMWIKSRSNSSDWSIFHTTTGKGKYLALNETQSAQDDTVRFNNTAATDTHFSVGGMNAVNGSGRTYISYLFATLAGVSKVGSFTNGSGDTDVDCGFSNGSRFVLLKRTDASGDWFIWDSARGISNSTEPYFLLNSDAAEVSGNYISPLSSGFTVTGAVPTGDYIFYAIA